MQFAICCSVGRLLCLLLLVRHSLVFFFPHSLFASFSIATNDYRVDERIFLYLLFLFYICRDAIKSIWKWIQYNMILAIYFHWPHFHFSELLLHSIQRICCDYFICYCLSSTSFRPLNKKKKIVMCFISASNHKRIYSIVLLNCENILLNLHFNCKNLPSFDAHTVIFFSSFFSFFASQYEIRLTRSNEKKKKRIETNEREKSENRIIYHSPPPTTSEDERQTYKHNREKKKINNNWI